MVRWDSGWGEEGQSGDWVAQVQQAGNRHLALSSGTSSVPRRRQRQKSQHPPESEAQGRAAQPEEVAGWGGRPFGAGHPAAPSQHTHTHSAVVSSVTAH